MFLIFFIRLICLALNLETLLDPNVSWDDDASPPYNDTKRYQRLAGKLIYPTTSMIDMSNILTTTNISAPIQKLSWPTYYLTIKTNKSCTPLEYAIRFCTIIQMYLKSPNKGFFIIRFKFLI